MARHRNDAGQALVVVALGMVIILGFLGLGLDLGYLRAMKRQVQKVADAAAIAGAEELSYYGGTSNCTTLQKAAQDAFTENGFTSTALSTQCASVSGNLRIQVNNPPCYLGTADPNHGNSSYVEVVVSQVEPLLFTKIFGINSTTMTARAEAALGGGNNCIYALDPSDSDTLAVDLLAAISSQCGIVVESNSNNALQCILASISASQIGIVGGDTPFFCSINTTPTKGIAVPSPADPLSYLTAPTVGSCGTSTKSPYTGYNGSTAGLVISGTAVLNPGVYCGGIEINNGANVTFNPGNYILTSATKTTGASYGLTVDIGAYATGTGVMFYNTMTSGHTAGPIQFNFTSFTSGNGINFTAPSSGNYAGILFYQSTSNTTQAQIIGSSSYNTVLQGAYYFPTAKVVFAFDGPIQYDILDAWQIEFAALTFTGSNFRSSGFSNNYSSLATGSPIKGSGGVIVE